MGAVIDRDGVGAHQKNWLLPAGGSSDRAMPSRQDNRSPRLDAVVGGEQAKVHGRLITAGCDEASSTPLVRNTRPNGCRRRA